MRSGAVVDCGCLLTDLQRPGRRGVLGVTGARVVGAIGARPTSLGELSDPTSRLARSGRTGSTNWGGMVAADLDEERLAVFAEAAKSSAISILLGAGASVPAGFPDWEELVVRLLVKSGVVGNEEAARGFVRTQDPMLAAEAARCDDVEWRSLVRRSLYGDGEGEAPLADPTDLHFAAASLAMRYLPSQLSLFTTNFDLLLEGALYASLDEADREWTVEPRARAALPKTDQAYLVHHLHGLVGDHEDDWESPILTLNDFSKLAGKSTAWQSAELYSAMQKGPLILAGTSFRDVDIRQWLHGIVADELAPMVIAAMAREGLQLSTSELEDVRVAIDNQWRAIGVTPVMFDDFGEIAQAIKELPYLDRPDYVTPSDRVRALRKQVLAAFDTHQTAHSEYLNAGREKLRDALGRDANLTLWLADGSGGLVRWASPDRRYKSAGDLRRITAAYDSPWVASLALTYNAMIAKDPDDIASTGRWRSVVAAPVSVQVGTAPSVAMAVLSSAVGVPLDETNPDLWVEVLQELSNEWSTMLTELVNEPSRAGTSKDVDSGV